MIELTQLKYIVAFKKYGTLSKTAEKLYISQPALTRAMQKMENDLQITLFERKKNKIELNENGKIVVKYAEKILRYTNDMIKTVQEKNSKSNKISIGSCAPAPLWKLIPLLTKAYPESEISYEITENPDSLIDELKNDKYHLIISPIGSNKKNIVSHKHCKESLFLSVPKTHKLAKKDKIFFSEIKNEKIMLFKQIGIWKKIVALKLPDTKFNIIDNSVIFEQLMKNPEILYFVTNLSESIRQNPENRIYIPISDSEATITYYYSYKKKDEDKFRKILSKIIPE